MNYRVVDAATYVVGNKIDDNMYVRNNVKDINIEINET